MVVLYCRAVEAGGAATGRLVVWLRHQGLDSKVADLIEAAGPLNTLFAQLSYMAAPFLGSSLEDLGRSLERPEVFIDELRQER